MTPATSRATACEVNPPTVKNSIPIEQTFLSIDPDVMGGVPVFAGTRVPIKTLVEYLGVGDTIDDFLEGFPSVDRLQVIAFLDAAAVRVKELAA